MYEAVFGIFTLAIPSVMCLVAVGALFLRHLSAKKIEEVVGIPSLSYITFIGLASIAALVLKWHTYALVALAFMVLGLALNAVVYYRPHSS